MTTDNLTPLQAHLATATRIAAGAAVERLHHDGVVDAAFVGAYLENLRETCEWLGDDTLLQQIYCLNAIDDVSEYARIRRMK